MDNQDSSSMSDLKERIATEIRPLIPQLKNPEDRFYALITLLRERWNGNLANEAFEAAKNIHDPEAKVRSMQAIMAEINYREHATDEAATE